MSLFPLGLLSQGGGGGGAGAFEQIATQVLGTNTTTVTFSSIPQTYAHLQLRWVAQTNTNQSVLRARFNSDATSGNYTRHYLYGDGSTSGSIADNNRGWSEMGPLDTPTNVFSVGIVDILDYSKTTKNKTVRTLTGRRGSANPIVQLGSSAWLSTSAITQIDLAEAFFSQNLLTGSRFTLYGIKG
jgi:hypothetical protein